MIYLISKQLEKVVDFSKTNKYRDFKNTLSDRCIVASNNIKIYNRVHEHPQVENVLSHNFFEKMPEPRDSNTLTSFFFDQVEHIDPAFGHAKSMRCRDCGFGIPYKFFLSSSIPSCSEHKALLAEGPKFDGDDHNWVIDKRDKKGSFGTKWICKDCESTSYYTYSWTDTETKRYWSVENPRGKRGTRPKAMSCRELRMDEAIG